MNTTQNGLPPRFRFTISTVNLHILDIRRHWKANMLADLSFPNIAISACHSGDDLVRFVFSSRNRKLDVEREPEDVPVHERYLSSSLPRVTVEIGFLRSLDRVSAGQDFDILTEMDCISTIL
jgi:hypothetical protein